MPQAWAGVDVAIVVPMATARAMFDQARRQDVAGGGLFEARGAAVLLWSATGLAEGTGPLGAIYVLGGPPTSDTPPSTGSRRTATRAVPRLK